MSSVALTGSVTLLLSEAILQKILLPPVAFSAGSLALGGAFFHLIPVSLEKTGHSMFVFVWVLIGFSQFLAIEQFLHRHHCQ